MRTIRMLLADDEPVILRGLRKLLPWHELGIEIVGEAYDGQELLDLMEACHPDLVISDISMPGCTGIDVIRHVHEAGLDIKVVFISAYQEFAYAQDAVKYGALDYLVKPVNKIQLEAVVRKAIRMAGERSARERDKEIAGLFEKQKRLDAIEEALQRLIDGDRSAAGSLRSKLTFEARARVSVAFGEMDGIGLEGENRWQDQERKLIDFAIVNVLSEAVAETGSAIYFRHGDRHGICILHDDDALPQAIATDLHQKINRYLKIGFTFGIGIAVDSLEEASVSARYAEEAIKLKYFEGLNRVISYEPTGADERAKLRAEEARRQLGRSLTQPGTNDAPTFGQLTDAVRSATHGNAAAAVSAVYDALAGLKQELADLGVPMAELDAEFSNLLADLNGFPTFETMAGYACARFEQLTDRAAGCLANKDSFQMAEIKAYIDSNYTENLTLESIAARIYMNPYYFSSFFKKHTGRNFKEYVTEIRMKNAHRLLLQTDLMVYEIADRVGYNNARHFSDMFKKRYGKLPLEYKQSLKNS
ncbi:response regulator [Cohnella sp. GbtcB17]|uniref:response regulator transcription factor n=1 Tax=Cohnella sp. GbtcB17 TaxID=2824762 RepID=UPI001C3110C6|nr:response regulator [Cohnella sp. GbtcB17]